MDFTILLYHGVTDQRSSGIENYSKKHINYKDFRDQMRWLHNYANVISMDELVDMYHSKSRVPKKTVVVTFDDGFKNNYTVAAPILSEFKIKTTFYITSGMIGGEKPFWVDEIESCLNATELNEITLSLGKRCKFKLGNLNNKIEALAKIKIFCKNTDNHTKNKVLKDLKKITKVNPTNKDCMNYQIMNWNDVRELSNDEQFIIGGHSLSHEILTSLDKNEMRENIRRSISDIELNIKKKVFHYSYPEGQENHFNDDVINVLKNNNIICSPSAIHGKSNFKLGLFRLKRIMVGFNNIEFPKELI
jgi:peptidoglycan/xylan/chitin deacetylase (PgdA/CDA1 family)